MALGYEGIVKLGAYYALGTGTSVPRARVRLESASGYGGHIADDDTPSDFSEMGIGAPHNYDWEQHDGTLNFEVSKDLLTNEVKAWLFARQTSKEVLFRARKDNVQNYKKCYWNSISLSASSGAAVDGSVGFVALTREAYVWGAKYIDNKRGLSNGIICPPGTDPSFPLPLNRGQQNRNPIPFWYTKVRVKPSGGSLMLYNFVDWTLAFTQEIVKFFGCTRTSAGADPGPQEPLYIAAGPMTATFSGSYILDFDASPSGFLGDVLDQVVIDIDGESFTLNRLETTTEQDDVQSGANPTPLTVEYAAYEIAA